MKEESETSESLGILVGIKGQYSYPNTSCGD